MELFIQVVWKFETQLFADLFDKAPVESHLYPGNGGKRSTCDVIRKSHDLGFDGQNSAKITISEQNSSTEEERAGFNDPLQNVP